MKKLILLIIAGLFITTYSLKAQIDDGWVEVGNAAYNSSLSSTAFITDNIGFAVGSHGTFLKTENGGTTWTAYNIGYNLKFIKLHFVSSTTGFLLGNDASSVYGYIKILKTTDAGLTWNQVFNDGVAMNGQSMQFIDANNGFASGYNCLLKTTNSGVTWEKTTFTNYYDVFSVFFLNTSKGFLATNSGAYATTDGGATWTKFLDNTWTQVLFTDNNTGYIFKNGDNGHKKTTDGGSTWNNMTALPFNSLNIKAVFINNNNGYVYTPHDMGIGKIAWTSNGGTSWELVMDNPSYKLNNISYHYGKLYACGRGGLIMRSTDMSNFYVVQQGMFKGRLNDICFIDENTAFAVGDAGVIVKTTDKCSSWIPVNSGTTQRLWSITSTSPTVLYAMGDNDALIKSVDGGTTWTNSNTGFSSDINSGEIRFVNANTGFVAKDEIFKTTNAGATWTSIKSDEPNCSSISIPNPDTMYVSCWKVLQSLDQGATWNIKNTGGAIYGGIDFINGKTGIVPRNQALYSTQNAGNTWTTHGFSGIYLKDAKMLSTDEWYSVGEMGAIVKTENAGISWQNITSNTYRELTDITFGPDGTGYILGEDGIILRKAIVETFSLTFNITDNGAGNIDNAVVTLNGFTYPAGQYDFSGLLPGVFNWSISAPTFCTQTGITNVTDDTEEMIVMDHCFQAIVTISNVYDNPVENASVTFAGNTQQTNAGGIAIFTLVQANNIPVNINAGNYLPFTGNVSISGDTTYVFVLNADIEAPVALEATQIQINSFTANWTKPVNADSCLLYVSEYVDFTTHVTGWNGKAFTGTSAVVNGLNPNKQYYYRLKAKNQYGITGFSNIRNCTTLPVSNKPRTTLNQNFVYPNPATDRIFIKTAGISPVKRIIVCDIVGKCVLEDNTLLQDKDLISLDISLLKTGTYIILLTTEEQTLQSVFIKK